MTTAEQAVTAWVVIGILWVVMGSAGLDLSAEINPNDDINLFDRRSWQRGIGLTLIVSGTAVSVEALLQLYLLLRH